MNWRKRKKLRRLSSKHPQFADKPYMYKRYVLMRCCGFLYKNGEMPAWAFNKKYVKFLRRKRWWEERKRRPFSSLALMGRVSVMEDD